MFNLKLFYNLCCVTQTKVGMPWLLEDWEVNTVLKTSETHLVRDLPVWQKRGQTAVYQHVAAAWLCHFSLIFDQEVACQPVFCRQSDLHAQLWSPCFPALERLTEMSLISRIHTSLSSVLNLDFKF